MNILGKYNGPTWTEYYPTGYINLNQEHLPLVTKEKSASIAAEGDIYDIIKTGGNLTEEKKEEIIETYSNEEEFIASGHSNPIWVLISFLITIWLIFLIAQ
jgi:hypothetical protein